MYICKYMKIDYGTNYYSCPYKRKMKEWRKSIDKGIKVPILCPSDAKISEDGTPICAIVKGKGSD